MAFEADGTYRGNERPNRPEGWSQGWVLHHMIDWAVLRELWNALVRRRMRPQLVRYLWIVGYDHAHERDHLADLACGGGLQNAGLMTTDSLAMCLCWQRYNLFEGPRSENRRPHASDPTYLLNLPGATTYDFPVVAPPHGHRAQTLWRAFQHLQAFLGTVQSTQPAAVELNRALDLLESVRDLEIIPRHEVNWFAVSKKRFWGMTVPQRQEFFNACMAVGLNEADGDAVYVQLFDGD